MKESWTNWLICPASGTGLIFKPVPGNGTDENGLLVSEAGWIYPVIGSIPRMNLESCFDYRDFIQKNFPGQEAFFDELPPTLLPMAKQAADSNKKTKQSFSEEWAGYDYLAGKTWGAGKEELWNRFLRETEETNETLRDKWILDAGAGNGHLDLILEEKGLRVIAMDLSRSVEQMVAARKSDRLTGIQGDIQYPPFPPGSFDLVQCSGVLIHTPDPKLSFCRLAQLVKPGGKFSIWVYHRRSDIVHRILLGLRWIMKPLPLSLKWWACRYLLFPPSCLVKKWKGNPENRQEMMTHLIDFFTPEFRWELEPSDVETWFRETGFENIHQTTTDTFGFNMTGIRQS